MLNLLLNDATKTARQFLLTIWNGWVVQWFKAPFSRQPGSQGLWFNPHPRHDVASVGKTINDAYLSLVEHNQAEN